MIIIDAGTFLVAAASLAALHVPEPRRQRSDLRWRSEITAGLAWLRHTPAIRQVIIACAAGWSVLGLVETLIYPVAGGLHRPPAFIGVLVALQGAGAIAGALIAAPLMRRIGEARLTAAGLIGSGIGWGAFIPARLPVTIRALVLAGLALTWIGIGAATLIQRSTPTDVLGRVDSVMELAVSAPQTMFIAVGAGLVAVIDYRLLLGVVLAAMTTSGTWLATRPEQRSPQRPPPDRSASRGTHRQLIAKLTARYPPPGVAPVRAGGRTARSAIVLWDLASSSARYSSLSCSRRISGSSHSRV